MRRIAALLVTVPITLVGIEAADALATGLFGSPQGSGELFASAGSGAGLLALAAALVLALVVVGLGGRIAGAWTSPVRGRAVACPFAFLPPVAFTALELVESLGQHGFVQWHQLLEPTFIAGLLFQLPFAAAGYLIARALLRASDAVRRLIVRRRAATRSRTRPVVVSRPTSAKPRRIPRRSAHSGRAPPAGLRASI